MKFAEVIKFQRTDYAKKIRKAYDSGLIKERMCNLREQTVSNSGISNTITTVLKDNFIIVKV